MESIDSVIKRLNRWNLTVDDMDYINTSASGFYEMKDEAGCLNESDTTDGKQEKHRRIYRLGGQGGG